MNYLKIIAHAIISLCLLSCGGKQLSYRFAAGSPATSYFKTSKSIAEIVQKETGVSLDILSKFVNKKGDILTLNSMTNCKLLLEGQVDFAIAQNDVSLDSPLNTGENLTDSGIRSVLPLYSEIFFIICKKHFRAKSLKDLIVGRKVAIGPMKSGTARFAKILFQEFGIEPSEYIPQYVSFEDDAFSDSIDVRCLVTGFNNPRIEKLLANNGKLFNLGDYHLANQGSSVDGFCLKYPLAKPYIIPKNTYGNMPQEPILTAAIDAVLLTRKDIKDEVVYNIVKAILENKQLITVDLNNKLLSQLTERFDPLKLRFPLHPGAKKYLERDKPSFLERYAESLGFIFSIIIALVGGVSTIMRWNRRRKKNRIDDYYHGVMNIQKQIENFQTVSECETASVKLKKLREKAFDELIAEKLRADESFRIFITLMHDIQSEIQKKIDGLK